MRRVPGVLVDRVNIGGNETGQQSNFASMAQVPRRGVDDGRDHITDMAATGASPSYHNYDNFEEIQPHGRPDIKQPTGGWPQPVVKRHQRLPRRRPRLLDNHAMESSNVPAIAATGRDAGNIGSQQADSDYGFDPAARS